VGSLHSSQPYLPSALKESQIFYSNFLGNSTPLTDEEGETQRGQEPPPGGPTVPHTRFAEVKVFSIPPPMGLHDGYKTQTAPEGALQTVEWVHLGGIGGTESAMQSSLRALKE
jgi:hypothetical protein